MIPTVRAGLLLLYALLLPACHRTIVKREVVEVPGPVRYSRIPNEYTDPLPNPPAFELRCDWVDKATKKTSKTACNEDMRAAYEAVLNKANADRAATKAISDKAVKRTGG